MKLRLMILLALITFFSPLEALGNSPAAGTADRPNIIFILTDDQRWDTMGCMDNKIIQTPNLDRLATRGVLFSNSFVTTSICAVSRASFLTGQYERRHRISDFGTPLLPAALAKTFPALLRSSGYRTGFIGKWGLGGALPEKEFDFWGGYAGQGQYFQKGDPEHLTSKLRKKALQFIRDYASKQPFLLCISFKSPHVQDGAPKPFQPDPRYDSLFTDVTISLPPTANERAFEALPDFLRRSEGRTRWEQRFATYEMYQESVKNYYRLIKGVDDTVGQVLECLEALKLSQNTIIIFSSDNGFFLGEHGLAGKWFMYEESIRVPLLIYHPQLLPTQINRRVGKMVLNIDLAPTILDLAGLDIPAAMQGKSLKSLMLGKAMDWREDFFYEHHFGASGRIPASEGVRTEHCKYIRYIDAQPLYEELFDLDNDPLETNNLAPSKQFAPLLKRMRERWRELSEDVR